jgi:hypothetical protein
MNLKISASVGKNGQNTANDVRLIKALLNTYFRSKNKTILTVDTSVNDDFYNRIGEFQKENQGTSNPDQLVSANAKTFKALVSHLKSKFTIKSIIKPARGEITWSVEGQEGGRFHSRILHVPSAISGLTIGRGYDMKFRSSGSIKTDLIKAGVDVNSANKISTAASLIGSKAKEYIITNDLLDFEITPAAQLALFNKDYISYEKTTIRLCNKSDVTAKYGTTNWSTLHNSIKEILIDLTYRGDFKGREREFLQRHVANNDFSSFKAELLNLQRWPNVPSQRFALRKKFLENAAENTYTLNMCSA